MRCGVGRRRPRDRVEVRGLGDAGGDRGVCRRDDLRAAREVDLVAVVARRVVAGGDRDARRRAEVRHARTREAASGRGRGRTGRGWRARSAPRPLPRRTPGSSGGRRRPPRPRRSAGRGRRAGARRAGSVPRPQVAFTTARRFMRPSPASTRPRRPAVPNSRGPDMRSARSRLAASSPLSTRLTSASSSARVSGSGSSARSTRTAARGVAHALHCRATPASTATGCSRASARLLPEAPFSAEARAALGRSLTRGERRGRGALPRSQGTGELRAALRARVAPAARRRAARVGIAGGPTGWAAALAPLEQGGRRADRRLAPEADAPDPDRRALADGVRARPRARLGARRPATRRRRRSSSRAAATSTATTAAARSPTSPRARTSSRPASPRPTSCAASCRPTSFARLALRLPARPARRTARRPGSSRGSSPTRATRSSPTSTASTSAGPGCSRGSPRGCRPATARKAGLRAAALVHREKGLAAVTGEHYEGGHWLGTFAVYLVTGRGLGSASAR